MRVKISLRAFFMVWADFKGWDVPRLHMDICDWLEERERVAVLEVFRGAAKSTITAIYIAWRLREDPTYRILVQSADDLTSSKMSSDAQHVIMMHPLCQGMKGNLWQTIRFSVLGNPDHRNASVTAQGVMGNVTSSRANEVIFDDVEVPKNVISPTLRETLRRRISDATHILVPGGIKLYIGTPHTHDSIYEEQIADGADSLVIPLFDDPNMIKYDPKTKKVEIFGESAWPKYFTKEEIEFRRSECKTQNEFDSQYLLKAKPLHEIRLDPEKLVPYNVEPKFRQANGELVMMLDGQRIVGCSTYFDVALGKADSDDSVLGVMFTTAAGHLYWHIAKKLEGEIDEQCKAIRKEVVEYHIPSIRVEVNGVGGFVPPILKKHLKGLRCGVTEFYAKTNKTKRILDAYDAPLSGRFLHVHQSVLDGPLTNQMRDWIPTNTSQPDDFLDAGAGCIHNTPVRIGKPVLQGLDSVPFRDWRPGAGSHEVNVELH